MTQAQRSGPKQGSVLTYVERVALLLILQGKTYRQAAAHMQLSPNTIKSHLARSAIKLGVNGSAAPYEALRMGYLDWNPETRRVHLSRYGLVSG